MNVIKHIICELTGYRPGTVDVSQGDRGSRAVSCRLLENGAPWMIPEGAAVRVAYTLPDGTEGLYDALPDGSPAGEIAGNTVTVELADQIMDQAGMAQVSILVLGPEGGQLATWPIRLMVIANKAARLTVPEHMPPYGAGFSGKIFFGGADGTITPLALGEGVAVERLPDGSWQLVGAGSGIAKETDPTVPEWAKQTNKPSYTAQEVGALPAGTKIPAKTSDLSNDSGFVTKAVNDLANYYTKAQTQELLAAIPRFRVTVVQQLPSAGEELVLYLVPFADAQGQYLEYIWVGGQWEVIGSQRVDLTGYATEAWVMGKLSALDVGSIQIGGGDGIRLESEGTASAPMLVLYGAHGDEPVRIAQVAPAQADGEAVPLGQVKQLVEDVVPSWAMADSKPGYTKSEVGLGNVANERQYSAANPPPYPVTSVNGKTGAVLLGAQDVMAEPVGAAASAVRAHNTNDAAHNDIRLLIDGLATRLNALANSTDTDLDQMAEIVAYIKSNKSLLDGITTSKVSVADIVNNLTTNVANRPLSAAQGVAIKALIEGLSTGKLDASKLTEAINTALAQAKASGEFDGPQGQQGDTGEDGVSPTVEVSTITGGHRITITDATGTKNVDVMDGEDGDPGTDGRGIKSIARTSGNGAAGSTDTYTITYTDGSANTFTVRNGSNGATGQAATLEITGVTALEYGAAPTVTEQSGSTAQARKYALGIPAGKPGENYVLTEADKSEIAAMALEMLGGNPVWGVVDANNHVVVHGLSEGTYTFGFVMEDGSIVDGGSLELDNNTYYSVTNTLTNCTSSNSATRIVEGSSYEATITTNAGYELESVTVTMGGVDISSTAVSGGAISIETVTGDITITAVATEVQSGLAYTNQIPLSTDASGNLYNDGQGWKTGYRLSSSSGSESSQNGIEVTGFIPCKYTDTIYFKNITITTARTETYCFYDSSRERIAGGTTGGTFGTTSGTVVSKTISSINNTQLQGAKDEVSYIRISANAITADSIITINEPIS